MERPERPQFGEDLVIDQADREYLDDLPEVEREYIMAERYEQMQRYKESMRIYEKHQTDSGVPAPKRRRRESPVPTTQKPEIARTSEKIDLSSLVARAEPLRVDVLPVPPPPVHSESEIYDNFRSICLSRDKALAVLGSLAPAAAVDCALRLPWPQSGGYVLGLVARVQPEDRKFVVKISGKQVTVPVTSVSNSVPSEKEISDFLATSDFDSGRAKMKTQEISLALEQRQPLDMRHLNPTLAMARLADELEIAKIGNSNSVQRLEREMEQVRKILDENKKKKLENTRNLPTRSREDISRIKTEETSTQLNPFKRRECAPTVMWDVGKNKKTPTSQTPVKNDSQPVSRSLSPERVKKEKFSVLRDLENIDLLAMIDLDTFLDRVESANISDIRFQEHQRAAQRAFPTNLRPLWGKFAPTPGQEVMTLAEWRTRVHEAQTSL